MPLNRTPPPSPAPLDAAVSQAVPVPSLVRSFPAPTPVETLRVPAQTPLHGCSSEPNLTIRKRKRSVCDNEHLQNFMSEMKSMFSDFKEEQEKSCDRLCSAVEDMRSTVDFLAQKIDALQVRVEQLEAVRKTDSQYIQSLENKLDVFERNSRSTCLEIRNIPVGVSESKTSLLDAFINTSKVLNVPIHQNQVKDIFRINTKDPKNKTIIVDLTSALTKEKVVSMFRKFNKGSKLTTEHLHISGPVTPIFISENLSSKMKRLFYLARESAKEKDYKFCWVSHGKIFARRRENGPLVRILTELDLDKLGDPM